MFSRQGAQNAKETIALFRPMVEWEISWFMGDGLVFENELGRKILFIHQLGADLPMNS